MSRKKFVRNTFCALTPLLLLVGDLEGLRAEEVEKEKTVYMLQQDGWEIIESEVRDEWFDGLPPYTSLRRLVSITTYWLQRVDEEIVCEISYDSQRDYHSEECGESYKILFKHNQ